jgi:hypothetical protein
MNTTGSRRSFPAGWSLPHRSHRGGPARGRAQPTRRQRRAQRAGRRAHRGSTPSRTTPHLAPRRVGIRGRPTGRRRPAASGPFPPGARARPPVPCLRPSPPRGARVSCVPQGHRSQALLAAFRRTWSPRRTPSSAPPLKMARSSGLSIAIVPRPCLGLVTLCKGSVTITSRARSARPATGRVEPVPKSKVASKRRVSSAPPGSAGGRLATGEAPARYPVSSPLDSACERTRRYPCAPCSVGDLAGQRGVRTRQRVQRDPTYARARA